MKGATFFSGGGGADKGMELVGIIPVFGIEYDDKIAQVARNNGLNVKTANILEIDANLLPDFDVGHFSPPCPQFSPAKQIGGGETENDKDLAKSIVNIIQIKQPKYITIENVWQYRKSESWKIILNCLYSLGYGVSVEHVDFSHYGVPQKRKRMIVRAIKDCFFVPLLPQKQKTKGWYEAVKDIAHNFEFDIYPEWQKKYITQYHFGKKIFVVNGTENSRQSSITIRFHNEPIFTLVASLYCKPLRCTINNNTHRLNIKALARLQTFPDEYVFPNYGKYPFVIIGNACPPVGMKYIFESMIMR